MTETSPMRNAITSAIDENGEPSRALVVSSAVIDAQADNSAEGRAVPLSVIGVMGFVLVGVFMGVGALISVEHNTPEQASIMEADEPETMPDMSVLASSLVTFSVSSLSAKAASEDERTPEAASFVTAQTVPPELQTRQAPALAGLPPASGRFTVQLGAYRSREEAQDEWRLLYTGFHDILTHQTQWVERAEIEGRGVYFRLRIGPYESASAAHADCDMLKALGRDCLALKRASPRRSSPG